MVETAEGLERSQAAIARLRELGIPDETIEELYQWLESERARLLDGG